MCVALIAEGALSPSVVVIAIFLRSIIADLGGSTREECKNWSVTVQHLPDRAVSLRWWRTGDSVQTGISTVMDASSFSHGCVGLCSQIQTFSLWSEEEKKTTRQPLSPQDFPFLVNETDANRVQPLILAIRLPSWVLLLFSCTNKSWISCGWFLYPCWRHALPSPWMRRRGATVCSPVSPSPCACVRGCPTTPPLCLTSWITMTSKPPLSPWR